MYLFRNVSTVDDTVAVLVPQSKCHNPIHHSADNTVMLM